MIGTDCSHCGRTIPSEEPGRVLGGAPSCRECADEQEPRCPYCDELLEKLPKRAKKCPHCERKILVRTRQTLFATSLLTKGETLEADWLPRLESHGIDIKAYRKIKGELISRQQGFSSADYIWAAYNHALNADQGSKAFDMARFLFETGRDPNPYLAIDIKSRLQRFREAGIETVRINSKGCCVGCRKLHGKQLLLDEAEESTLIPQVCCTREAASESGPSWCLCSYTPVYEDDDEDDFN